MVRTVLAAAAVLLLVSCEGINDDGGTVSIRVEGNGLVIESPHLAPNTLDGTHFGTVAVGSVETASFELSNETGAPIEIDDAGFQGGQEDDFRVTRPLPSVLPPGGSADLEVAFVPTDGGARSTVLTIGYDDGADRTHYILLAGNGEGAVEIDVTGGSGVSIANGDSSPSTADGTDFGTVDVGGGDLSSTFTIHNLGSGADLALTGSPLVAIAGTDFAKFSVGPPPADTSIAPGSSSSFVVTFDNDGTAGNFTAVMVIPNNDSDEGVYLIVIEATVTSSA